MKPTDMAAHRVLYLTHDGLTDNIGQSQVLPYLLGLAREGFGLTIISAEKAARAGLRPEVTHVLQSAGIAWHYVSYHNRPPLVSTVFDLTRMYRVACRVLRQGDVGLIHARGFLPVTLALLLKRRFGVPVIFDFRDFWADRRLHSNPFKFVYRHFKRREGGMIRNSDHVVTLTQRARTILHEAYLTGTGETAEQRITVIPTCVDIDLFDTDKISPRQRAEVRSALAIPGNALVFGYLGTVLDDYIPGEMFRAFQALRSLEPRAVFLLVSPTDRKDILRYAQAGGVPEADIRIVSARRAEVPRYLAIFDLSVVFIRPDRTTAGVSPTKLAELFACNIPVLASAGVGDMDEIVSPEANDSVLVGDFSEETLQSALRRLLALVRLPIRHGRAASMQFSLAEGINRYRSVYLRFVQPVKPPCLTS
ncbi:MAG: hypothetical protein RL077_2292 [Verrucomicrobiota bacterium]|jgi:glycosyltransferase involved in cell wall biosynthesis